MPDRGTRQRRWMWSRVERHSRRAWLKYVHRWAGWLPPTAFQWLRYLFFHGALLPVRRPRTFLHRLALKMARDRDELLTVTADKAGVRGYVEQRVGPSYLTKMYALLNRPEELMEVPLPARYVVKPTHASGRVVLVEADEPTRRQEIVLEAKRWFAEDYWRKNGEWAYRGVKPRLMVEEYLVGDDGFVPPDWRYWCFGGRAELVQADFGRFRALTRNFYTPDGARLDLRVLFPPGPDVPLPSPAAEMRRVAEELSRPFDFVRVDFYVLGDRVVVGELTHYPGGGNRGFDPREWDLRLGEIWAHAVARMTAGESSPG